MRGLSRTIAFEHADGCLVSRSARLFGFVPMQGAGAHQGKLLVMRGGAVTVRFDDEFPVVVDLPGARTSEAWTALLHGANGVPVVDALVVPSAVLTMDLRAVLRVIRGAVQQAGVPYLLIGTKVKTPSVPNALHDLNAIAADGVQVARQIIRDLSVHSEAVTLDRPITDMPGGRHSTARAVEREYRSLAAEVFALLGMKWPADLLPTTITDHEEGTE